MLMCVQVHCWFLQHLELEVWCLKVHCWFFAALKFGFLWFVWLDGSWIGSCLFALLRTCHYFRTVTFRSELQLPFHLLPFPRSHKHPLRAMGMERNENLYSQKRTDWGDTALYKLARRQMKGSYQRIRYRLKHWTLSRCTNHFTGSSCGDPLECCVQCALGNLLLAFFKSIYAYLGHDEPFPGGHNYVASRAIYIDNLDIDYFCF